jgi:tRNA threonylcarbamoyladenosine biosynthesis protein TsaB
MSTVLAIDTASTDFALAIAVDGEVTAALTRDGAQDHSRLLLAAIEEILGDRRGDLAGIVAVRGPGSYAGLRVGLATAQGLALALAIPIVGIGTMNAIVRAARMPHVTAVHPAGRGDFALQEFTAGEAGPLRSGRAEDLRTLSSFAGEGASAYGGREISPETRCRAALETMLPAIQRTEPGDIDAIYLREPNITTPRRPLGAASGA